MDPDYFCPHPYPDSSPYKNCSNIIQQEFYFDKKLPLKLIYAQKANLRGCHNNFHQKKV
jgi:hypothetical protein